MMNPILCVEDDPDIGRLVQTVLENAGYEAQWVQDGEQALERWSAASLILLDIMLPGIAGLEVCRRIRQQDKKIPVIMLTALAGTRDVIEGFEIGADDYITKPFDSDILLVRIQAALRRYQAMDDTENSSPLLVFDELEIDIARHRATLDGKLLALTAREFSLLTFFARHPGQGFSRHDLLDAVWGEEFDGFEHTVNTHINRLRSKIEKNPAQPRYILTVWGVGYRFNDVVHNS